MLRQTIAIIDFGSQYSRLTARRVREHNVYSEVFQPDVTAERLSRPQINGKWEILVHVLFPIYRYQTAEFLKE